MVNLKSASFGVIMLLHKGLTRVHSQKKPRLVGDSCQSNSRKLINNGRRRPTQKNKEQMNYFLLRDCDAGEPSRLQEGTQSSSVGHSRRHLGLFCCFIEFKVCCVRLDISKRSVLIGRGFISW